jgi:hypothetical protein
MTRLLTKIVPTDPIYRSLIQDLRVVRQRSRGLLPRMICLIIQCQPRYDAICLSLARNPNPDFQRRIHAIRSDLAHAQYGYPPQIDLEAKDPIMALCRTRLEARRVRRLFQHLERVRTNLSALAHQPIRPIPHPVQPTMHTVFLFAHVRILHPVRVSSSGHLRTPSSIYKVRPLPNARSLLRMQAAIYSRESLILRYEATQVSQMSETRLRDRLLAVFAGRRLLTTPQARRRLGIAVQDPSRAAKWKGSPLDRVLAALPVTTAVEVLADPAPNLEYRAIQAWADIAGITPPGVGISLRIGARTISRRKRDHRGSKALHRIALALTREELEYALTPPPDLSWARPRRRRADPLGKGQI